MKSLAELAQVDRTNRLGDFASACRYTMLGRGDRENAASLARSAGASPRVLELLTRAVIPPGDSTDTQYAGALVSPTLAAFTESLKFNSAFAAADAANLLVKVPIGSAVGTVMAGAAAATEVDRGDPVPVRLLAVSNTTTPRRKVAAMCVLTNELLKGAPQVAEMIITRELRAGVSSGLDTAFVATITAGVATRTTLGTPLDDAAQLMFDVDLGAGSKPFWVAGPTAAIWLATRHVNGTRYAPDVSPTGGTFMGWPLFVSSGVATGTLVLVDGSGVAAGLDGVEISSATHAVVESTDAPTGGLTTGSPNTLTALGGTARISLWQQDLAAVMCRQFFGVARLRNNAVASISLAGSP
jgi:hypothetical protein